MFNLGVLWIYVRVLVMWTLFGRCERWRSPLQPLRCACWRLRGRKGPRRCRVRGAPGATHAGGGAVTVAAVGASVGASVGAGVGAGVVGVGAAGVAVGVVILPCVLMGGWRQQVQGRSSSSKQQASRSARLVFSRSASTWEECRYVESRCTRAPAPPGVACTLAHLSLWKQQQHR